MRNCSAFNPSDCPIISSNELGLVFSDCGSESGMSLDFLARFAFYRHLISQPGLEEVSEVEADDHGEKRLDVPENAR
ncbi:MAG: hypothetical protein ACM3X4_00520 [Ignavibacteriales bacterium]